MMKHVLGSVVVCLAVMAGGEAWACSCAFSQPQFGQFLVDKQLPSNAPGVGVIATHWPKTTRVMPKSVSAKIQLHQLKGKKRVKVPFVVEYLGQVRAQKALNAKGVSGLKIDPKAIKPVKPLTTQQKHLRALYENTYLIKPVKGFVPGVRYEVSVRSPVNRWQLTRKEREANVTEKAFTAAFLVDKLPLTQKTFAMQSTSERATVRVPAGASCSRGFETDTVLLTMKVPDKYKRMFLYSVFANDQMYTPNVSLCSSTTRGRSLVAPLGQERFYSPYPTCVQKRKYKLDMVVAWPGTSTVWWAKPQEVKLDCSKNKPASRWQRKLRGTVK